MRKVKLIGIIIGMTLLFIGCQSNSVDDPKTDENIRNEEDSIVDIYDFSFIKMAPESTEKQSLENVIKVYFSENDSALNFGYAIDLKENVVYTDSLMGSRGLRTSTDEPIHLNDVDGLIEILQKYDVQTWEKDYTIEKPDTYQDGYGWQLWLQYEDGTVEKHGGQGTDRELITPSNFNEFVEDFSKFVDDKLQEK